MKTDPEVVFGVVGLFAMFNIECSEQMRKAGCTVSEVAKPLWRIKKCKLSRGLRRALSQDDNAREECKVGCPGSKERLAKYTEEYNAGRSPFVEE